MNRYRRFLMLFVAGVTVYCILSFLSPFEAPFYAVLGCAMLVIVLAALALDPRWRREARSLNGCCVHCGYDLRGTRGTCPECGKLVPPGTPVHRLPAK